MSTSPVTFAFPPSASFMHHSDSLHQSISDFLRSPNTRPSDIPHMPVSISTSPSMSRQDVSSLPDITTSQDIVNSSNNIEASTIYIPPLADRKAQAQVSRQTMLSVHKTLKSGPVVHQALQMARSEMDAEKARTLPRLSQSPPFSVVGPFVPDVRGLTGENPRLRLRGPIELGPHHQIACCWCSKIMSILETY